MHVTFINIYYFVLHNININDIYKYIYIYKYILYLPTQTNMFVSVIKE